MATLTVQDIDHSGLNLSATAAAAGGDQFANDGRIYVVMINGDASQHTLTVDSQSNCSQGFDHDVVVNVPAGEERRVGPFSPSRFNDANGNVQLSYDAVTSVTVAAVRLVPNP